MKKYGRVNYEVVDSDIVKAFTGWTIVAVGKTLGDSVDHMGNHFGVEGGLTFILEKDGVKKKVILGYTELGEWLEYEKVMNGKKK